MTTDRLTIQIGQYTKHYYVVCTSAPKIYDGMGTIHMETVDERQQSLQRVVLIETDHLTWQKERYRSGMYFAIELTDPFEFKAIQGALWDRLIGKGAKGD